MQALLSNLLSAGGDPRQAARRGTVSAPDPVAASVLHARAPAPHPPSPSADVNPDGSQLGLLQLLADSGGAESLLVALNRRCDTLEAQNAVLRTKVLQLYPPGEWLHAQFRCCSHGLHAWAGGCAAWVGGAAWGCHVAWTVNAVSAAATGVPLTDSTSFTKHSCACPLTHVPLHCLVPLTVHSCQLGMALHISSAPDLGLLTEPVHAENYA